VTVNSSGKALVLNTPSIPGPTFDLAVVSPGTVASLVDAVGSKASPKQSDIGYVTVSVDPITNKPLYGVYPVSGTGHYQANIDGGDVKAFGGAAAGAASTGAAAAAPTGGSSGGAAGNAQAIASCVSKAGGDPTKLAKCANGG
jgi:hypothetical protein